MPQRNRGPESSDSKYFAPKWLPIFTSAVDDLCYLLSRGYASNSGIELVGNRYRLNKRQRNAILRISSSDSEIRNRKISLLPASDLENKTIEIDGFNLLILLESALSGAYIFKGRDGTYRDIASVHGSYKRVGKTEEAIILVGQILKAQKVKNVKWYLDQPISNSGRLKTKLLEISEVHGFNWEVVLVFDPDKELVKTEHVVVSSDGWILDAAKQWFNLGGFIVENHLKKATVIVV